VSAVNQRANGRGKVAEYVTGTDETEIAALRDLDARLRGVPKPNGRQLGQMRRRLRRAYVEGADVTLIYRAERDLF
jgi:hypothetical protein